MIWKYKDQEFTPQSPLITLSQILPATFNRNDNYFPVIVSGGSGAYAGAQGEGTVNASATTGTNYWQLKYRIPQVFDGSGPDSGVAALIYTPMLLAVVGLVNLLF